MNDSSRRSADGAKADWPALVLAAGLATRLQPLSSVRAKAALPVAGDALIARILRRLHAAGIRRVVINLHHLAASITRIVGDGSSFGLSIRYSWEPEVLGSAGGPARAIPLLESDRFLIVNGDTLTDIDLPALVARHVDTNAQVTMAVVDGDRRYNGVIADDTGVVRGFGKSERASHFIGIQAVNAAVFAGIDPDARSETVHGFYPAVIATRPGAIRTFHVREEFFDIGSPSVYLATARALAAREHRPLDRGEGCVVADDARVAETILWDRVSVGARAELTECVVADDVVVPPDAKYSRRSLVMRDNALIAVPF
ncbi:MAG TPA: nucleotidyltransferase family protein [Vicinamibacterales bacterium]|nr:nucleotidyltransferase family protein [Vicinamibacterales bacterium]